MARRILLAVLLLAFLHARVPAGLAAETEGQKPVRMEEVVVTASPIIEGNRVNDFGGSSTVVTEEQIADLNAQDLPSALRLVPGVGISRHNPIGSFGGGEGGAITIRGMGSSRPGAEIQTLVDGIPKFVSVWSHPLMDTLSVDPVERIEVYKGAQPLQFGNSAFGAVNLVTKRRLEEGFTTRLQGGYGSYNTLVEVAEHGGKVKDTDYYLVQSFRSSSGHRENAGGQLQEYFGRVGQQLTGNWYVSLTANGTSNYANDPGPEGRPQEAQGTYKVDDTMAVATLAHAYSRSKGDVKAYWNGGRASWVNQVDLTSLFNYDTITCYENYGVRARENVTPWTGGSLLAGVDLDFINGKVEIDRASPRPDAFFPWEAFRIVSPYAGLSQEISLGGGWSLVPSAGIRHYSHSDFDPQWAPQAGLVLRNPDTDIHASYGRGVSYPGIFVAAQSNLFWGGNTRWKDLDPETVDHFEAGVSHSFTPKIRADVTFFHDKGQNRFILVTVPAPPRYENIAEFRVQGVEATVTFSPTREFATFAGATWIADRLPANLPYVPEWSASAGMNWRFLERFRLSLDALWQAGQYAANTRIPDYGGTSIAEVGGFFLLNGKISWEFRILSPRLTGEIFLAGENLADQSYAYKKDYPMPGITGMVGVNLKF
ncbi:MAG: TonB-dependent receptor [Syntrophaceae bacterium]